MMEPADLRNRNDAATWRGLHDSWLGTVVVERLVGPRGVVVAAVAAEEPAEMGLVPDEEMIQALPADGADHPLHERVLPGSRLQSVPVARSLIRITHPFHPLRGQTFRFVVAKQLWGEDRVTFERPDGSFHSVPVGWTDFVRADPYLSVGRGRSYFRLADLRALATLVAAGAPR